jgi:anaerobic magnesium-protoporphyrin IX monomethyl ester cyclase
VEEKMNKTLKKVLIVNPVNWGRDTFRPPFGLMLIHSLFEKYVEEVHWLDADIYRHDEDYVLKKIKKHSDADLIAIGGMHTCYAYVKSFFKKLEENNIDIPVLVGGRLALTLDYLMWEKIPNLDMICKQEAEYVVESICENFPNREKILGIHWKNKDGEIIQNKPAKIKKSLDEWPAFDWTLLRDERYFWHGDGLQRVYLLSSIGCPFKCSFCRVFVNKADLVKTMDVYKFIDEQIMPFYSEGWRYFTMVDEFFLLHKARAAEFCEAIEKRDIHCTWRASGRADILNFVKKDIELLQRMSAAGLDGLNMGLESGSQKMLDAMNKKVTVEKYESAIKTCRAADIQILATWIFGLPGETRETALESVAFRERLGLGGKYFYATPYPGSDLYTTFKEKYALTLEDEEEYFLSSPSLKRTSFNFTEMSDGEFHDVDMECRERLAKITTNTTGWLGVAEKE